MTAATPNRNEFSRGLSRQIAARGALYEVYRELSDHWTLLMQQLFPVWLIVGPGLAEPAHIDVRARTVYLDSDDLLGSRQDIVAGRLERYRVLVRFGAAFHEVGHAKHTKRWVIDYEEALSEEGKDVLVADRRLLEEPRMEAHTVRDYPERTARGQFIRRGLTAAVTTVILARLIEEVAQRALAGAPLTRDMCGRAMTYLAARTHYGIVDPATLAPLQPQLNEETGLDEMMPLIEKSSALKREVTEAVARSGQKLDDIRCDGQRFPGQWRNLGGERVSPYVCKIADKWLEVRATVRVSGRGKAFEAITPEAIRSATTVTEINPTWKWLDHEPN